MKEKIKEVAKLLKKWQDKTRKEKGLPSNRACDLEPTKEENKELAILMVKLENGVMNDGSDEFWEKYYEVVPTDEDFYTFYEHDGTIWVSWNALGDGPLEDEPKEWIEKVLELIKTKTIKQYGRAD